MSLNNTVRGSYSPRVGWWGDRGMRARKSRVSRRTYMVQKYFLWRCAARNGRQIVTEHLFAENPDFRHLMFQNFAFVTQF